MPLQLSEVTDQDDQATVVEVLTDEDESEAESEEELNLARKSSLTLNGIRSYSRPGLGAMK